MGQNPITPPDNCCCCCCCSPHAAALKTGSAQLSHPTLEGSAWRAAGIRRLQEHAAAPVAAETRFARESVAAAAAAPRGTEWVATNESGLTHLATVALAVLLG